MCRWPAAMFLFIGSILFLVAFMTVMHVYTAAKERILAGRLCEIAATVYVFLLVNISDPSMHLHHWFTAFLIGQHANQK
jgi:hypothetical protein